MNADMKILRDEHTEVLHSMFQYEKNNATLNQENEALKNIIGTAVNQSRQEVAEEMSYIQQNGEPNVHASMTSQNNNNSHLNIHDFLNP